MIETRRLKNVVIFIQTIVFGRLKFVGQRPLKSLSSVCQSARQSVTKFSDIVSSDIAHDDSWP